MNPSNLEPAPSPNLPLGPSGAPADSASDSGISGFAVLVAIGFLGIVAFFGLSLIAVWKRSEADSSRSEPAPVSMMATGNVSQPVSSEVSPYQKKATVKVPRLDMKHGILRLKPAFDAPEVAFVPRGTTVDVGPPMFKAGQTWYRVRARVNGKDYEGWMHSDILDWVP